MHLILTILKMNSGRSEIRQNQRSLNASLRPRAFNVLATPGFLVSARCIFVHKKALGTRAVWVVDQYLVKKKIGSLKIFGFDESREA